MIKPNIHLCHLWVPGPLMPSLGGGRAEVDGKRCPTAPWLLGHSPVHHGDQRPVCATRIQYSGFWSQSISK